MSFEQKRGWIARPPIQFGGCCHLAPLSGVTDPVFRRIARRFGAGLVVSEMVASDELVAGSEEARLRAERRGLTPHVVQLAGCEPAWIAEAARLAEAAGADAIDLNMGCPAKRVTGGLAGSALMRDLDAATRLIEAAVAAVGCPVTVKMRLGWDERSLNAPELARRAEAAGAKAVTVHGRTRQQFFKGAADWAAIAAVVGAVRIPVIANGDIGDSGDAKRALEASGAVAVMIGRAAMGQPWIVGQVSAAVKGRPWREPSRSDKTEAVLEHYDGILSLYGREVGVRHARKHLAAYADRARESGLGISKADRTRLLTADEPGLVASILRRLFDEPLRDAA